ncbi:MAG: TetR/AcrR family transcriptional regulator [Acidobacteriota bacterium]
MVKPTSDQDKRDRVLEGAREAFTRHGFRRVTMGDLAEAAGMSRPALYLVFPNKEEIFKAVLEEFAATALAEIREGLAGTDTTRDALHLAFDTWTVRPFELLHHAAGYEELSDCTHGFAREVVTTMYRDFEVLLVDILEPEKDGLSRRGLTTEHVARVLAVAVRGFKETARDVDELRALIEGILTLTLAAGSTD